MRDFYKEVRIDPSVNFWIGKVEIRKRVITWFKAKGSEALSKGNKKRAEK